MCMGEDGSVLVIGETMNEFGCKLFNPVDVAERIYSGSLCCSPCNESSEEYSSSVQCVGTNKKSRAAGVPKNDLKPNT